MGPPPFGDGMDLFQGGLPVPVVGASMGPPPFGDGMIPFAEAAAVGGDASMGPPPFGDGMRVAGAVDQCPASGFNGATAFRRWNAV